MIMAMGAALMEKLHFAPDGSIRWQRWTDRAVFHNGKLIEYQSIGDDASSCTAQSTTSSLGCLLRLNVSGLPAGGSLVAPTFTSLDPGDNMEL